MKNVKANLQARSQQRLGSFFKHTSEEVQLLHAPSDLGVILNGGRNGSKFGPLSLENCLKSFIPLNPAKSLASHQLLNPKQEYKDTDLENLVKAHCHEQTTELNALKELMNTPCSLRLHLGGGHDHAYPLLKAIEKSKKDKILYLNLDAHLDTRTDTWNNSGTPFRQFAEETQVPFELVQVGTNPFSNAQETFSSFKNPLSQMRIFPIHLFENLSEVDSLLHYLQLKKDYFIVVGVDCDILSGSQLPAVSAANALGLPYKQIRKILDFYRNQIEQEEKIIGFYEYNPVYDDMSASSAKKIAYLIYESIYGSQI